MQNQTKKYQNQLEEFEKENIHKFSITDCETKYIPTSLTLEGKSNNIEIVIHCSYLINLSRKPDDKITNNSINLL